MSQLIFGSVNGFHAGVTFVTAALVVLAMAWRGDRRTRRADLVEFGPDVDALEREATVADWGGGSHG